jgi:hypothetical protein
MKELRNGIALIHPAPTVVADTLEQARAGVPYGDICTARHPDDDPKIYEVWM